MWFRRDLRLADNPALGAAVAAAGADHGVVPLFVLDLVLSTHAGVPRRAYLAASLDDLGSRVPQLAEVDQKWIHQPWTLPGGPPRGYPAPILDHDQERRESLRRLGTLRGSQARRQVALSGVQVWPGRHTSGRGDRL